MVTTRRELRERVAGWRRSGETIGFVPTMGYLHEGHLSLVDRARELAGRVVLSVFVNPLQFGADEDLESYPRDLERDRGMAGARGVDLLFAPSTSELYPFGELRVAVVPERGEDRLCGRSRPGHFRGVLTVVAKLFGIVQPDLAVFGQKDYQQQLLIRWMVRDLDLPVRVETVPVAREPDGLAMSSRNRYLSGEERGRALALYQALERCEQLYRQGERSAAAVSSAMREVLARPGVELEYAEVAHPRTLEPLDEVGADGAVCAVAARVGGTRLIDNTILANAKDVTHAV